MVCLFRRLKLCVKLETLSMLMCLKTCCIGTTRKLYLGRFPVHLYWVLWIWRSIIIYERRHDNVHKCNIIVCKLCQFKITSNWNSLGAISLVPPSRAGRFIVSLHISPPKQLIVSFILLSTFITHSFITKSSRTRRILFLLYFSSFIFLILSFSSISFLRKGSKFMTSPCSPHICVCACMYVRCNISANW